MQSFFRFYFPGQTQLPSSTSNGEKDVAKRSTVAATTTSPTTGEGDVEANGEVNKVPLAPSSEESAQRQTSVTPAPTETTTAKVEKSTPSIFGGKKMAPTKGTGDVFDCEYMISSVFHVRRSYAPDAPSRGGERNDCGHWVM